jgi:hypothetical protein
MRTPAHRLASGAGASLLPSARAGDDDNCSSGAAAAVDPHDFTKWDSDLTDLPSIPLPAQQFDEAKIVLRCSWHVALSVCP